MLASLRMVYILSCVPNRQMNPLLIPLMSSDALRQTSVAEILSQLPRINTSSTSIPISYSSGPSSKSSASSSLSHSNSFDDLIDRLTASSKSLTLVDVDDNSSSSTSSSGNVTFNVLLHRWAGREQHDVTRNGREDPRGK